MNEIRVWSIGGMIVTGKTEVLEEKPVPVTLYPPQILPERFWDQTRSGLHSEKSTNNCLSYSMGLVVR
jgi:hypothetical protein